MFPVASQPNPISEDQFSTSPRILSQSAADRPCCASCKQTNSKKRTRKCDKCGLIFHLTCVGLKLRQSAQLDIWYCPNCTRRRSIFKKVDTQTSQIASTEQFIRVIADVKRKHGILQRIPKGARILAAETLSNTVDKALRSNDFISWAKLFSFATCCLNSPRRAGDNTISLASFVKNQLNQFRSSTMANLTEIQKATPPSAPKYRARGADEDKLRASVKSKLMDGDISAAVRLLADEDSVADVTPDVIETIRSKHPPSPSDSRPPPECDTSIVPIFTKEAAIRAVKSFAPSSSGGIDGLRPRHLKDLLNKDTSEAGEKLLSSLASLVNHIVQGKLPDEAKQLFFSASLIALKKKDGGLRPIAVGNLFRRLAAKVVVKSSMVEISDELRPIQLGCGVQGGCEAAVHAARTFVETHLDPSISQPQILIKVDVKNAFNTLRRDHMLEVLKSRVPMLYPLACQAYSSPTKLLLSDTFIDSSCGIQQGDPLGPLAFALSVDEIARSLSSSFNVWYLDDATIAGPAPIVLQDLANMVDKLGKIGLTINPSKCEVVNLGYDTKSFTCIQNQLSSIIPSAIQTLPQELCLLGSPILSNAISKALGSKKETLVRMTSRLKLLDAHPALFLLTNSLALPKLIYTLRSAPCYTSPQELADFDCELKICAASITNVNFDDEAWRQATLPVRHGGLGIRQAADVAMPAYFSSTSAHAELVSDILPKTNNYCLIDEASRVRTWTSLGVQLPADTDSQHNWDEVGCRNKVTELKRCLDQTRLASFHGASMPRSGAWLQAIPNPTIGTFLDDATLRIAVALRVGADVCEEHPCKCGQTIDRRGHHPLSCKRSSGRFPRHSALNDVMKRALDRAGLPSILEPVGLDRGDGKRPDGMTTFPYSMGRALVWDATCMDTYATNNICESAVIPGSAAKIAEDRKIRKYSSLSERYYFQPIAFETSGAMGPGTARAISELARRIVRDKDEPREAEWLFQRFSLAIIRGNAVSILSAAKGD